MVKGGSKVEAIKAMWGPRGALRRFFVNNDGGAGWCQGCCVEIEGAFELCPCGHSWIDAGRAEKIQSKFCLRKELVPFAHWKVLVC